MVLARLRRVGSDRYEGRIIRVLNLRTTAIRHCRTGRGQFTLQSAARGGRDVITWQTNGDVPCREGDWSKRKCRDGAGYGKNSACHCQSWPVRFTWARPVLALAEFDIPKVFPEEIIAETMTRRCQKFVDALTFVTCHSTIDGADARDFDDAVLAEPRDGGWQIRVSPMSPITYAPILN